MSFLHRKHCSNVWKTNVHNGPREAASSQFEVNKAINQVNQMKVWNDCHNEMVYWSRMELANRARRREWPKQKRELGRESFN